MKPQNIGIVSGAATVVLAAVLFVALQPRVAWDERFMTLVQEQAANETVQWGWLREGQEAFRTWTQAYHIPGRLAYELFHEESRGKVYAHNATSGCRGLGQIHETTAQWFHSVHPDVGIYEKGKLVPRRLYEPAVNVRVSLWALRWALDKHNGNVESALVTYNAGYGSWSKAAAGRVYAEAILGRTSWWYGPCLGVRKCLTRFSLRRILPPKGDTNVKEKTGNVPS